MNKVLNHLFFFNLFRCDLCYFKTMQVIGYILIIFAVADFGLSWLGYNLTPFLPVAISKFSPIIIGAIGYFFLNAQNMGSSSNDDPALDRFRDKPKKRKKK